MAEEVQLRSDVSVKLVQSVGDDKSVVASAIVSSLGSESARYWENGAEKGRNLIRDLVKNKHGTPFEHNLMTFLVEAPIFVFREWHRHRIGWSYNEFSARYQKKMKPIFWAPDETRPLVKRGPPMAPQFVEPGGQRWEDAVATMKDLYETAWRRYEQIRDLEVANEIARAALPVGIYSSMYATCNARSLMHFLQLRTQRKDAAFPSYPQMEIAQCAELMEVEFAQRFPITYEAFNDFERVAP